MEKMKKISKVVNVFLSIFLWFGIVMMAICIIAFGIIAIFPEFSLNEILKFGYDVDMLHFELAPDIVQINTQPLAIIGIVVMLTVLIYHVYMVNQLKNIFRPIAEGTPFVKKVSASIRNLAISYFIFNIVYNIMKVIMDSMVYHELNLDTLFLNENILSCSRQITFDPGFIFVSVIFLAVSYVFKYGEELQKLSDETL